MFEIIFGAILLIAVIFFVYRFWRDSRDATPQDKSGGPVGDE